MTWCKYNSRFPCGHCIECRMVKQAEKAMRISHELQYHKDSCFVTFTYKPELRPVSLSKKEAQDLIKRLRKRLGVGEMRYFLSGEYGELHGYPHYHAILFGVAYNDKRLFSNVRYVPSDGVYRCDCDAWNKGFVTVDKVTDARVRYVAKYLMKKVYGEQAKDFYGDKEPEFSLSSRKPGLGFQWAIDHEARLKEDDYCTVRGVKYPVPRYYIDKLYNPIDKIKRAHKRDDYIMKEIEKHRKDFESVPIQKYGQLIRDKIATAREIIAKRISMKRGPKCSIK